MANAKIANTLIERGADVNASAGPDFHPSYGPRPLHIAVRTDQPYRHVEPFSHSRLSIARLLLDNKASVDHVADHIKMKDLPKFQGFEDVWKRIRAW